MFKKVRNQKGFTLIELIVVIAILAILAAIAIPRLSGFTDSAKINADYSTAATIGHAAEVYLVDNPDKTTIALSDLTGAKLLPDTTATKAQSSGGSWTITITTDGDITVGDGTDTLYPHN